MVSLTAISLRFHFRPLDFHFCCSTLAPGVGGCGGVRGGVCGAGGEIDITWCQKNALGYIWVAFWHHFGDPKVHQEYFASSYPRQYVSRWHVYVGFGSGWALGDCWA